MPQGAWSGTDRRDGILADLAGDAAARDGELPFAHAHERDVARQLRDDAFGPGIIPAPVPDDQLRSCSRLVSTWPGRRARRRGSRADGVCGRFRGSLDVCPALLNAFAE